ncbi:MAG: heavy-metal-associated domain-containing protein [Gemmatimonadota bacterium]
MTTTTLRITGMTCDHCVRAVTQALERLDGVARAEVDLTTGRALVEHHGERVSPDRLSEAVMEEGYQAEELA